MSDNPFRLSAAQRIALCPGSVAACSCLPKGQPGPEAERGTRIHGYLASYYSGHTPLVGIDDEAEAVEQIVSMTDRLVESLGGIEGNPLCEVDVRAGGWSGHVDFMAMLKSGDILVVDWKTPRRGSGRPRTPSSAGTRSGPSAAGELMVLRRQARLHRQP